MTVQQGNAPYWLDPDDARAGFPDVELALKEPDGLLAIGGDLSVTRLLDAYRHGIFPWYSQGQPILWWAPDPRLVLRPADIHISKSLAKVIRQGRFEITMDNAFTDVISACGEKRPDQTGTWITPEMSAAYSRLHELGYAHSVECWHDGALAGGLYGISLGHVFFGESMFSRVANASKVALVALARQLERHDFSLIDCQVHTGHLESLGAYSIPRSEFSRILAKQCAETVHDRKKWQFEGGLKIV